MASVRSSYVFIVTANLVSDGKPSVPHVYTDLLRATECKKCLQAIESVYSDVKLTEYKINGKTGAMKKI